jgi:hypothetical protein
MLTRRVELDIPKQYHFIVLFRVKLRDEYIFCALAITAKEFFPGADDPGWRLFQSFAVGIFTNPTQKFADQLGGIDMVQWRRSMTVPGNLIWKCSKAGCWLPPISSDGLFEDRTGIDVIFHTGKAKAGSSR